MELKVLPIFRKIVRISRKECCDMGTAAEARAHLESIMGPVAPGTPLKALFPRVARLLGVTVRRVETLWQGTARRVDAAEMDRLRALVAVRTAVVAAPSKSKENANAARYDAIADALESVDPDFNREDIARYRALARQYRGFDLVARGASSDGSLAGGAGR